MGVLGDKKRLTKVETQISLWEQRGVLEYIREWMVGNYNKGWSPCKLWEALKVKHATDIELSPPQIYELVDKFTAGVIMMNADDLMSALSGEILLGMQRKDACIRDRVNQMATDKLAKQLGLADDTSGKRSINISINGAGYNDASDVSSKLSNIGTDTMERLKGDPAYDRLMQDRIEEEQRNG